MCYDDCVCVCFWGGGGDDSQFTGIIFFLNTASTRSKLIIIILTVCMEGNMVAEFVQDPCVYWERAWSKWVAIVHENRHT